MLYKDAAHAYDDDQVILLSKQRIPQLTSRLVSVQAGDAISLSTYVHYSSAPAKKTWQKIGAAAAGLAIGSLPHLLDKNSTGGEGNAGSDFLKKAAPLVGAGVASLPFVLNKRKGKAISKNLNMPMSNNGLFVPDAYLSYTFYDLEGKVLSSEVQSIDKNAKDAWQQLSLHAKAPQDGYVQVEVGNSSKRPVWVEQQMMVVSTNKDSNPQLQRPANNARKNNTKPSKGTNEGESLDSTEVVVTEPLVQNYSSSGGYYSCRRTCYYSIYGRNCNYHDCVWVPTYSDGGGDEGGWGPGDGGGGDDDGTVPDPRFMTNNLSPDHERDLLATIEVLERNCFYDAMLDNLHTQPTIMVVESLGTSGTYDAVNNTVRYKNRSALLSKFTVSAELFHTYQQQYTGRLDDAQRSSDKKGMSNFEFEEKFMSIVAGYLELYQGTPPNFYPPADFPGFEGVNNWVFDIVAANGGTFPTSFTADQELQYATFLRAFQSYNANPFNPGATSTYGSPLDTMPGRMLPNTLFDILRKSNC